ncbi:MAG: carboxymuconolactone decarboxylase family protein [Acidimicrobiia bacterium]
MSEASERAAAAVAATPMQQVAPYLVELSGTVLFGDIWERPGLSPRDRSLATLTVLIGKFRTDELRFHLGRALDNGVTREEVGELITHLAFYYGWPVANNACQIAAEVFAARDAEQ